MKLTLKARLSVVGIIFILLAVGGTSIGLYGMYRSNQGLKTVYEDRTVALEQVSRIDRLMVRNRLALAEAVLNPSPDGLKSATDLVEKNNAEINQAWDDYMATYLTPEENQIAQKFSVDKAKLLKEWFIPAVEALKQGKLDTVSRLQRETDNLVKPTTEEITALRQIQVDVAKDEYGLASNRYSVLKNGLVTGMIVGLTAALAIGALLIRNIYRELGGEPEYAAQVVRSIANSDLTVSVVTRNDDNSSLLFSMRHMQENLLKSVKDIRQATETIANASVEIASGNLDLSSRTEQQAGSLEETASAMEQLTATVKQNADHAREANSLAESASAVAVQGGSVVGQMVDTMGAINDSSRKIVDIISVIDGIAFQTNILALNAAVEAARAGEQGRGFAVVASEVRGLAQRSAGAAKEIKSLIHASVETVENGTRLVEQAGNTMQEVVDRVKRVTEVMNEMTAANREQSEGIEQINLAITQMDEVTQQNAALVEEAAAAAQSLQDQAGRLNQIVRIFKLSANDLLPPPGTQGAYAYQATGLSRLAPHPTSVTTRPATRAGTRELAHTELSTSLEATDV